MALGFCIRGFRNSTRPVITMDETFLKALYKSTMFVAVCKDGNNSTYPLTFGVSDLEHNES